MILAGLYIFLKHENIHQNLCILRLDKAYNTLDNN
jgi:hypothetical protein